MIGTSASFRPFPQGKYNYKTGHYCFLGFTLRCNPKLITFSGRKSYIWLQGGKPYPSHYLPVSCVTFHLLLTSPVHFANLHKSCWDLRGMGTKQFVSLWQLQTPFAHGKIEQNLFSLVSLWKRYMWASVSSNSGTTECSISFCSH